MSDLGPLSFGERDDLIFLGRELAAHKNFSEHTAELIDNEVKKIVGKAFDQAKSLIDANRDKLFKIAEALLEKEILSSDEIAALIGSKPGEAQAEPVSSQTETVQQPAEQQPAKPETAGGELKLDKQPES